MKTIISLLFVLVTGLSVPAAQAQDTKCYMVPVLGTKCHATNGAAYAAADKAGLRTFMVTIVIKKVAHEDTTVVVASK